MPYLSLTLLISAALFSGLTVLFILLTIRSRREHKNTIFPVVREMEGVKAKRFAVVSGVFLVLSALSIGGWVATQQDPQNILIAREATQQAASQQTRAIVTPLAFTPTPVSLSQQVISESLIAQGQASPTVSPKIPTNTPTVAPPTTAAPTPAPTKKTSPAPAPDGVSMGPIVFSARVNTNREAENPTAVFDTKTKKVYAVFPYQGMKNGIPFSVIWYYQNVEIVRDDFEWDWGSAGQSYFFVRLRKAGAYKVEFRINDKIIAEGSFKVTP